MYRVTNNEVELTRGDSLYCQVGVVMDGDPYTPEVGDTIRFYLKRDIMTPSRSEYVDRKPLITKTVPTDTMILHLEPSDTKELPFGNYVYDMEITFANGDVDTFINNAKFVIAREVG